MTRTILIAVAVLLGLNGATANAQLPAIQIQIVGPGSNAEFIKVGDEEPMPVSVTIGDRIEWINRGNRPHTATASLETDRSQILFDTGELLPGDTSDPIEITQELFQTAGGVAGETLKLEYVCDFHPSMVGQLEITQKPAMGIGMEMAAPDSGLHLRRNIRFLTPEELNRYRDAWRMIQSPESGAFQRLAGFHGCPRQYCHRVSDGPIFLAWHRQYMLELERELQVYDPTVALHYWDWTSATSISSGLPAAFTEDTYISPADDQEYPNPLKKFLLDCGGQNRDTIRNPGSPGSLFSLATSVRNAYGAATYRSFNSAIDAPHGGLHTWFRFGTGGMSDMFSTTYAAYDPVFWAHHSNVDRQWASWQEGGGPAPSLDDLGLTLRGFPGQTVGQVVSFRQLGYEYDQYDSLNQFGPEGRLVSSSPQDADVRTFEVAVQDRSPQLVLTVAGMLDHPPQSLLIHVFVNQPDATADQATDENPNFVGSFGLFGGNAMGMAMRESMATTQRQALTIPGPIEERIKQRQAEGDSPQVTLLAVDGQGRVVPFDRVPINNAFIEEVTPPANMAGRESVGGESDTETPERVSTFSGLEMMAAPTADANDRFQGFSNTESFDEAYRDAVNQAQRAAGPDQILEIEVQKVRGVRGGIAGLTRLMVEIRVTRR